MVLAAGLHAAAPPPHPLYVVGEGEEGRFLALLFVGELYSPAPLWPQALDVGIMPENLPGFWLGYRASIRCSSI
jgi:hypothetical protein